MTPFEQIFPTMVKDSNVYKPEGGMTQREHFAGVALQGLLSNTAPVFVIKDVAKLAVDCADALIKQLAKGP